MPLDRLLIYLATGFFFGGFAYAFLALRTGTYRPNRSSLAIMAAGFLCQCGFLAIRGKELRQCPVTNVFELLIFVAWSMVLLYFLIGTPYRWSLLGMFTAPLVFLFHIMALASPDIPRPPRQTAVSFWSEFHISVSLLSYGAFALACVAGAMFLIQDRQLKKKQLHALFYYLPPINNLHHAIRGLLLVGFILLTAGIASAYKLEQPTNSHSLLPAYVVWGIYGLIIGYDFTRGMSARKGAIAATVAFSIPLITLWLFAPADSLKVQMKPSPLPERIVIP